MCSSFVLFFFASAQDVFMDKVVGIVKESGIDKLYDYGKGIPHVKDDPFFCYAVC